MGGITLLFGQFSRTKLDRRHVFSGPAPFASGLNENKNVPWFLTGVTHPFVLQSTEEGNVIPPGRSEGKPSLGLISSE